MGLQNNQSKANWVIPIEIRMPTVRTEIPEKANVEAVANDLDTTDELQEAAVVGIASY